MNLILSDGERSRKNIRDLGRLISKGWDLVQKQRAEVGFRRVGVIYKTLRCT